MKENMNADQKRLTYRQLFHKDRVKFEQLLKKEKEQMSIENLLCQLITELKTLNMHLSGQNSVLAPPPQVSLEAPAAKKPGRKKKEAVAELEADDIIREPEEKEDTTTQRTPMEVIQTVMAAPANIDLTDPLEKQARELLDLVSICGDAHVEDLIDLRDNVLKVEKFSDLPFSKWGDAIKGMKAIVEKAKAPAKKAQNFV